MIRAACLKVEFSRQSASADYFCKLTSGSPFLTMYVASSEPVVVPINTEV
jgi:hypothetical protein